MNKKYKAEVYLYQRRDRVDTWGRWDPPLGRDYRPIALFCTHCACPTCIEDDRAYHSLRVLFLEDPKFGERLWAHVQFLDPKVEPTPVFHLMEGKQVTGQVTLVEE